MRLSYNHLLLKVRGAAIAKGRVPAGITWGAVRIRTRLSPFNLPTASAIAAQRPYGLRSPAAVNARSSQPDASDEAIVVVAVASCQLSGVLRAGDDRQ